MAYSSVANPAEIFLVSLASCLAPLFKRDLARLGQHINAFSDEAALWQTPVGITNSVGNLVLHLEGNLREYVGRQLGGTSYTRDRPREFAVKAISREELAARVAALEQTIPPIIEKLTDAQLDMDYPEVVLEKPLSTRQFLVHLYGHLNWHLGQIDSTRRMLTGGSAIKAAGL